MTLQKPNQVSYEPSTYSQRLPRGAKNERIFRILLCNPEGTLTRYKIAKLAQAQQIQVSLLLDDLEKSHLVRGTRVTNPKDLLMRWGRLRVKYESRSYMLNDILGLLKRIQLKYALTTYQAETSVSHYLFPSRTELYIRVGDYDTWHGLLVKEGALVGGGNVRLRWYDDHVFYNSFFVNEYRIVSIPQLIVDLLREGGVTVQAAVMMMEKYTDLLQLNQLSAHQSTKSSEADW
ncbi:MAG: hypothetical protein ACREBU_21240 [Nitrososphaera sp.]